ncbi:hypothetical protein [Algiphilus sp.]|uniref:hypothetical protein n=1 Tax=Algiphilus sp. TaxID=1872431 RepID=UPI0032F070C8
MLEPIILIHVPKTCGTALRRALQQRLGSERVVCAYPAEEPVTSQIVRDTIHSGRPEDLSGAMADAHALVFTGHFSYQQYAALLQDFSSHWCVFFRDPVQRLLSEHAHRRRHQGMEMSLEDFVSDPRYANLQHRFTRGLDLEAFAFIGISERYGESLALFAERFGVDVDNIEENVARSDLSAAHPCSTELRQLIVQHNALDMALYEKASRLFEARAKARLPAAR